MGTHFWVLHTSKEMRIQWEKNNKGSISRKL